MDECNQYNYALRRFQLFLSLLQACTAEHQQELQINDYRVSDLVLFLYSYLLLFLLWCQ